MQKNKKAGRSKITLKSHKVKPLSSQALNNSLEVQKKKMATGALLTFYRALRDKSRRSLTEDAHISVSLLAMVENAKRLPSQNVLEKLSGALRLTAYQRLQLHAVAGYSTQLAEAPGWEIRADDVIHGIPLFLRDMNIEFQFQQTLEIEEIWIITPRPLALDRALSMLREGLLNTNANYVYFVDARFGEHYFRTLWDRLDLKSDTRWEKKQKNRIDQNQPEQLRFVLSPPTLCASTHSLALFNPRSAIKPRFGRGVHYSGGTPIGVYSLDSVLYEQLVGILQEVYLDCEKAPGTPLPKDAGLWGSFRLLAPSTLGD